MRLAIGTITVVTGLLLVLGMAMLHSIGMHHPKGLHFFQQQAGWIPIALLACILATVIDYRYSRSLVWGILIPTALLLILARIPGIGREINGAWRWIRVSGVSIQPSEFAKIALVLGIAAYADSNLRRMPEFRQGILRPGVGIALLLGLVLMGKDLGTTALLSLLAVAMLFAAGARFRYLLPLGLGALLVLGTYLALDSHRSSRVDAWLHPEKYILTLAHQSEQSKTAIGSGGTFGRGLGNGILKAGYVPEQPTDFIFSVIGEELGLRVTLPLVAAYLAFVVAALAIARRAPDTYGSMIAVGVGLVVGLQAAINIAVTTAAVPNKGLALPFVSYGGSCLVVMLTLVGLLLNVALRAARESDREYLPAEDDRELASLQST